MTLSYFLSSNKYEKMKGFIEVQNSTRFSYISKFHIIISCKLIVYIVMCFYQETN